MLVGNLVFLIGLLFNIAATCRFIPNSITGDKSFRIHMALMLSFSQVALTAFLFAITDMVLPPWLMGTILIYIAGALVLNKAGHSPQRLPDKAGGQMSKYLLSWLTGILLGIAFFTPNFIPSSMTGDPARHFQTVLRALNGNLAGSYKPLLYVLSSIPVGFSPPLLRDKFFIAFMTFVMGLSGASLSTLLSSFRHQLPTLSHVLIVFLCIVGYPFFSLQYGYYTLLLSSVFFTSTLAVFISARRGVGEKHTALICALLGSAVLLSHPFLMPALFISMSALSVERVMKYPNGRIRHLRWHMYGLTFIGILSLYSLGLYHSGSVDKIGKIVKVKGFVDSGIDLVTLLPLLISGFLVYLIRYPKHRLTAAAMMSGPLLYIVIMVLLRLSGHVAPYYVYRIQLLVIPFLGLLTGIVAAMNRTKPIIIILALICAGGLTKAVISRKPLSKSKISYSYLRNSNESFYLQNIINTKYSPLQMTNRDRRLLQREQGDCYFGDNKRIGVIGTDHETLWAGYYTGKYPSVIDSNNFCHLDGYGRNLQAWLKDKSTNPYLIVLTKYNYSVSGHLLAQAFKTGNKICTGDSFTVLKRR